MLEGAVGGVSITFLPGVEAAVVVAAGAAIGVMGSWIAIGRYADA
jgi:hypothetical protein